MQVHCGDVGIVSEAYRGTQITKHHHPYQDAVPLGAIRAVVVQCHVQLPTGEKGHAVIFNDGTNVTNVAWQVANVLGLRIPSLVCCGGEWMLR